MPAEAKLSSKGQIVIPKDVRKKMGLKPGDIVKFDVLEGKRAIMQPSVEPPSDVFVKAKSMLVEETIHDAKVVDDTKVAKMLRALGITS